MKKTLIYGMAIGCSVLLLAGCGDADNSSSGSSKKKEEKKESANTQIVSCKLSESEEGFEISSGYEFTFDKDKKVFTKGGINLEYVIEDEDMRELLKEADLCEEFEEDETIKNCKSEITSKGLKASVEIDLTAAEEAEDQDFEFKKDMSVDELVEALEDEGLTCTVK